MKKGLLSMVVAFALVWLGATQVLAKDDHKDSKHKKDHVEKSMKDEHKKAKHPNAGLRTMVEQEIKDRQSGDEDLKSQLEGEAKARETGDEELKGQLNAEAQAREAADTQLKLQMDQEIENRDNAYFHLQDMIEQMEAAGAGNTGGLCPPDMVAVGPVCVDKYEASVWSGQDDLATQYGVTSPDYPCSYNGNDCPGKIFARSLPNVMPSRHITWFQAQQACANAGKRLLTNAEWQMAAAGTPDDELACNTSLGDVVATGSQTSCVSAWGVNDMVGNLDEWVADWMQDNADVDTGSESTSDFGNDGIYGIDEAYPEQQRFPGAVLRGGHYDRGRLAGVFALNASRGPANLDEHFGFRCGR